MHLSSLPCDHEGYMWLPERSQAWWEKAVNTTDSQEKVGSAANKAPINIHPAISGLYDQLQRAEIKRLSDFKSRAASEFVSEMNAKNAMRNHHKKETIGPNTEKHFASVLKISKDNNRSMVFCR